jgi:hypothetical protein
VFGSPYQRGINSVAASLCFGMFFNDDSGRIKGFGLIQTLGWPALVLRSGERPKTTLCGHPNQGFSGA